jgi:excisionase family DNA binding protein
MMISASEFMTVREVALSLRLNPLTIYEYIRSGKLVASRFGRYYRIAKEDFSSFIERQ